MNDARSFRRAWRVVTLARWTDDTGVATVLGIAFAVVLLAAGIVLSGLTSIYVAHQRASVAADLAALGGASGGCATAQRVAVAHGAIGVSCSLEGMDAIVTVALPAPDMLNRVARWTGREAPVIVATARAGVAVG